MELSNEVKEKIEQIFMPYAAKRKQVLLNTNGRLAHYTTAENAIKILGSKSLWLRNARSMQDFSEVEYGFSQLKNYFQNETNRAKFSSALDGCGNNIFNDAIAMFDQWWAHIQTSTYISCFSEHTDAEDLHGRLSMWRAFGRNAAGVAIVIHPPTPYSASPLKVFLTPVAYYFTEKEISDEFNLVFSNIESNQEFLKEIPRQLIVGFVYSMLMMAAVSLKHPGFHEEREWRLCHFPVQVPSPHIPSDTEIVGGIPQIVHKVLFENKPEEQINQIEIPQLLDRVIIGPSQYAGSIWQSLVKELGNVGVEKPESKVIISGIPLRG